MNIDSFKRMQKSFFCNDLSEKSKRIYGCMDVKMSLYVNESFVV